MVCVGLIIILGLIVAVQNRRLVEPLLARLAEAVRKKLASTKETETGP